MTPDDILAHRQMAYRNAVTAAVALPRNNANWNARFVEILSMFNLRLSESQLEPWYDEAPRSAPNQINGWDRCWIGEENVFYEHGRRQVYRWPDMKVLAQHATGCAIVQAASVVDARSRIINYSHEYLRAYHGHWYDNGELIPLFKQDYEEWMNALFDDLKEEPLVSRDPIFILGSY